jgi:hypothetical protein
MGVNMPRIKTVRVINAQFNDGQGIYENFKMNLEGHSTIYELPNGGGKTVLLLLLMQCVIPNASLDKKKPFKFMMTGGDEKRTTHVIIEWELDDGVDNYKYLLTGFCAKKRANDSEDSQSENIKKFNYTIRYSEANEYDICNIPLCETNDDGGLKVTKDYADTLSMLKLLEKSNDSRYRVQVFEKQGLYKEKIKKLNLIESEFELIRQVNQRENYLKDYFRGFVSSKKLIQDLLIATIDNCLRDKHHIVSSEGEMLNSEDIAISVYKFRKNLKKLQEVKKHFKDYDILKNEAEKLATTNIKVIKTHESHDEKIKEAASQYISYKSAIQQTENDLRITERQLQELNNSKEKKDIEIDQIALKQMEVAINNGQIELTNLIKRKTDFEDLHANLQRKLNFAYATDKYILIRNLENKINVDLEALEAIKKDKHTVYDERDQVGNLLYQRYSKLLKETKVQHEVKLEELNCLENDLDSIKEELGGKKTLLLKYKKDESEFNSKLENLKVDYSKLDEQHRFYDRISSNFFGSEEELDATKKKTEQLTHNLQPIREERIRLETQKPNDEKESKRLNEEILGFEAEITSIKENINKFNSERNDVMELVRIYDTNNPKSCLEKIAENQSTILKENAIFDNEKDKLTKRIKAVEEFGYDILNEDIENISSMLDEKYGFALSGMSHLKKISTDKREEELSKAPWLPKSVLVTSDTFKSIVENPSKLPGIIKDSPIIITNIDHFNSDKKQITVGDVFIPHREYQKYIENFDVNKTKQILIKKIANLEEKASKLHHTHQKMKDHDHKVDKFVQQYLENQEQDYGYELTLQLTNKQSQKKSSDLKLSNIQAEIRVIDEEIKQKISDLSDLQDKLDNLNRKLKIIQKMHDLEKTCDEIKKSMKSCKLESEKLEHQLSIIEGKFTNQKIAYNEKSSIVNQITNELDKIKRVLNHIGQYNNIKINIPSVKLEELENNELCNKFKALDKIIRKTDVNAGEKEENIRTNQMDIRRHKNEIIEQYGISWEDIELKNPQQHCPDENKKRLKDQINNLKNDIYGLNVKCNNATAKQMASDISFNEKIDAYCLKSNEKYVRTPSLQDASIFEDMLINLKKECLSISSKIEDLTKDRQSKNSTLSSYTREYDLYEQLEYEYQLTNYNVAISDKLEAFAHTSKELNESKKQIQKLSDDFSEAVKEFISKTTDLEVDVDYVTNIWVKFPVAHSLSEAHDTASNLDEYSERVSTDIAIIKEELDSVQSDENILVDRVLRFTQIYKDHLKDFPSMSKIKVTKNKYENLVRIDFDRYEYPEEQARDIIKKYIQDLLNDDKIDEKKLINRITPRELIGKVIDLDSIRVQIRKLDKKPPYKLQDWEKINASDGQENAMYIVFLASLLSYIREIVLNRNDIGTSKILIVDNPFGSTGAGYLWERIWSIMERNKIQLICPGHNIDPTIRSFFPVSYLLTEDMSTNGRTRVVVKESNINGESINRAIQLRNGQMTLGHEFIN